MAQRVNLDAMVPREDFAIAGEDYTLDKFEKFPIQHLESDSPIFKLLRKPNFQRETMHWSPEQIAVFIESFLDNEVIPALILWKSPNHIFVIDGGHRLSALKAWLEDDYGDGALSGAFYKGEISDEQKKNARKTRKLVESRVGRFTSLKSLVDSKDSDIPTRRAKNLFIRNLVVQWVQGDAGVAESSFYKINSQGTPLDETEEMLIRNRRKPIAIAARSILRAGTGNKYWSSFEDKNQKEIEQLSKGLYNVLFEPEVNRPIKTLDLPLGGNVSPLDALSVLIELLTICRFEYKTDPHKPKMKIMSDYDDDLDGNSTITTLQKALIVLNKVTGNSSGSLGLHPAVYFYNDRGKHSRFMFLGVVHLFTEKLRNNDQNFFKRFSSAREKLEVFLLENKTLLGFALQNMGKNVRVQNIKDLLSYLVNEISNAKDVKVIEALTHIGLTARIIDVTSAKKTTAFSDDVKSMSFIEKALENALKCPICRGMLDPNKSVSYDHRIAKREGGDATKENCDLVHPYCNTAIKG